MNNLNEAPQGGGSAALDMYFVYKFAKFISMDWTDWEAYKLGIIDDKGNVIKKNRTMSVEKQNYTFFHRLLRKLKQLMEKLPGMKSKLGKAAAAYFLFKEELVKHGTNAEALDEAFLDYCNDSLTLSESMQMETIMSNHMLLENIK
jgi:IS1 family transposase